MTYDINDPNGDMIEVLKDLANKLDTVAANVTGQLAPASLGQKS